MKNVMILKLLLTAAVAQSQVSVQPVASGDYWQLDAYQNRLPELAMKNTFPATLRFTNGYVGISEFYANPLTRENEIIWNTGAAQNVASYIVEYSRDARTFERAGVVRLDRVEGGRHVFHHSFFDDRPVYYRIGIVSGAGTIAYTPAVRVLEEEHATKVFPTIVKGSAFYVQTGRAFEKLQVINSASQSVYEKGINGQTGTLAINLPSFLPKGIYFVRLLSTGQPQHVQRVMVD